ncbi:hypothetical protein GALL_358960 [mine drainage metagenome]|uniref:Uncharacterized protein n=1 Tax=mine drainage metagenome TaxID=410659 RepID=A0A1J5QFT6_9ZZZZ
MLDGATLQQVVAHHQRGAHAGQAFRIIRPCCHRVGAQAVLRRADFPQRRRLAAPGEEFVQITPARAPGPQHIGPGHAAQLALQASGGHRAQPQPAHAPQHLLGHQALHPHRVVQPRLVAPAVVDVVAVVDQVDAADEGHLRVHHAQLAMQAAPMPALHEIQPAAPGPVDHEFHAAVPEQGGQLGDAARRPQAVDHHAHLDAAPRRVGQGGGQIQGHRVVMKDVGFQPDAAARLLPGRLQCGEQGFAQGQEIHAVAAGPGGAVCGVVIGGVKADARRAARPARRMPGRPQPGLRAARARSVRFSGQSGFGHAKRNCSSAVKACRPAALCPARRGRS